MRALLQRSERGTEDLREQLNEEVTKRDRIKVEIDQLLQEIARWRARSVRSRFYTAVSYAKIEIVLISIITIILIILCCAAIFFPRYRSGVTCKIWLKVRAVFFNDYCVLYRFWTMNFVSNLALVKLVKKKKS